MSSGRDNEEVDVARAVQCEDHGALAVDDGDDDDGLHGALSDFVSTRPDLRQLLNLRTIEFPKQGVGLDSEFAITAPIWTKQPFKLAYMLYFGLSIGLFWLPVWALTSIPLSGRGHHSWCWRRAVTVKLFRRASTLTYKTHLTFGRDLSVEVPHSATRFGKFTWIDPVREDQVRGDVRRTMLEQGLRPARVAGFWYGDNAPEDPAATAHSSESRRFVFPKARQGEKVLYHCHGGAMFLGTAHEQDITAAVSLQSLAALKHLYQSSAAYADKVAAGGAPPPSKCTRSFSIDYRLCVPGRPALGSWPAPLLDTLAGYLYLVRELRFDPDNIILVGDSAGGNLCLALCRYLRDEHIERVPGKVLLLSPWADISRSHGGPLDAPMRDASAHRNAHSDIISSEVAFRNTAVSALLGHLPAREAYRNPYISSVSLHLSLEHGGAGPHFGFEHFPDKVLVTTGTAEISYDQHITLAHRLAAGTRRGRPVYAGDRVSAQCDPGAMCDRLAFPRPADAQLDLSRANSALSLQGSHPSAAATEYPRPATGAACGQSVRTAVRCQNTSLLLPASTASDAAAAPPRANAQTQPLEEGWGAVTPVFESSPSHLLGQPLPSAAASANSPATQGRPDGSGSAAGRNSDNDHSSDHELGVAQTLASTPILEQPPLSSQLGNGLKRAGGSYASSIHRKYTDAGVTIMQAPLEVREVVLHEVEGAIHDYLLFPWFEPQRSRTWRYIAHWIEDLDFSSKDSHE
ncbi:alpha/beta-hydrolase [Tilletiaria anomala UBC 951]|uniref:Alpha/beta-hydrolase n=1 Tax=Tilletiaria anomala (strain ATCC 24038 / CBS 436.72 / UBC 951) TaxID=1037660 RepID=A0A066VT90_TILAU|nr:alpha/beta-hydrolase [Tilletiaria anomala UBC 951]KDN44922.1 alpha/beta-hydrolase [Tilletiaria anomala UBC 951]